MLQRRCVVGRVMGSEDYTAQDLEIQMAFTSDRRNSQRRGIELMLVQLTTATPAEAIALIGGRSCKDGRFMVDCLPVDPTYCLEGETLQIWGHTPMFRRVWV